jgi:hypothetical protein
MNFLLATLLLYWLVNRIEHPSASRSCIYFLLFSTGVILILYMGIQYSMLRYVAPLVCVTITQEAMRRTSARSRIAVIVLTVIFSILLLLISPETAIGYAFACFCLFPLTSKSSRLMSFYAFYALLLTALAGVFFTADRLHVFETTRSSGSGSESFPIVLSLHIVLFFVACFICAIYFARGISHGKALENTAGIILYSVPMLVSSLGRCDPGHVATSGMGIFLVALFYASNYGRAWKWCRNAYILAFVILNLLTSLWLYSGAIANVCAVSAGQNYSGTVVARDICWSMRSLAIHLSPSHREYIDGFIAKRLHVPHAGVNLDSIYPNQHGVYYAPFGYRPNTIADYTSPRVEYGHFHGIENVNSLSAIQGKVDELHQYDGRPLLLPDRYDRFCQVDYNAERTLIRFLFVTPFVGQLAHHPEYRQPMCDFIQKNYLLVQAPSESNYHYGLWIPRNATM